MIFGAIQHVSFHLKTLPDMGPGYFYDLPFPMISTILSILSRERCCKVLLIKKIVITGMCDFSMVAPALWNTEPFPSTQDSIGPNSCSFSERQLGSCSWAKDARWLTGACVYFVVIDCHVTLFVFMVIYYYVSCIIFLCC